MQKTVAAIFLVGMALCSSAFAGNTWTLGVGFYAPAVNGKANASNAETGAIVFDLSDSKFYGNTSATSTVNWVSLMGGSASLAISTKTTNYTLIASDDVIRADASGGAFTLTLPAAASNSGKLFRIIKVDTTDDVVTVDGNLSETIDGATTYLLFGKDGWVELVSDGTNWNVVASKNPWRVDANISGSNDVELGGSAVSSYTGLEDSALSLTNNAGSGVIAAEIPCSSTNASSGTTCSAGNESLGVSFELPLPGEVRACAAFNHVSNGLNGDVAFQIVETPNNAQTISQEGKDRVSSGSRAATLHANPVKLCGTFSFTSAGKKTIRLMYEQNVTSKTDNQLRISGSTAIGQRDLHWEVYPIN